jgi:hypothetical protein
MYRPNDSNTRKYMYNLIRMMIHHFGRRGRDRMIVGFTTIYAISTYPEIDGTFLINIHHI